MLVRRHTFTFQTDLCGLPLFGGRLAFFSHRISLIILFWKFALQVFQNVIRSSIDILQGIPKRSDIYFCATGHLVGSGLADVLNSALMLTVFCYMNVIVNRFLVGLNELQCPSMLVAFWPTGWVCVSVFRLSNWCWWGNQSKAVWIGNARQAIR